MFRSSESPLDRLSQRRQKLRQELPERIADHQLLRLISAGSYGDVWLARNELTGTYRAIKFLWKGSFDTKKPYERELEAIMRFEPISRTHPGLVHVLQTGRLENGFYYVMELADDISRGQTIDVATYEPATLDALRGESLGVEQAIQIGISLTTPLRALHTAGLIHRDIKPSNVIFVGGIPKLADIGLIAAVSEANSIVGTNGFMAPEGPMSVQADIYSLGKLLYEAATGHDRFNFPTLPQEVTPNENLLLELNQILLKACDPDPAKRHSSVDALRHELEFLVQGRSIRRVRQLEKALRWTKASFATTCLLAAAAFFMFQSRQTRKAAEAKIQEHRIVRAILHGNEMVSRGDYLSAINSFCQGALLDSNNSKEHRLRLGSVLAYAPTLVPSLKSDSDVACFAENSTLFASLINNHVQIVDVVSKQLIRQFPCTASFLAMDPNGRALAVANGKDLKVIDLKSGGENAFLFDDKIKFVSMAGPEAFVVSTDGGSAYLFPGNRNVSPPNPQIYRVTLCPSGRFLCILEYSGRISVLNSTSLQPLAFRASHESICYNTTFFPDERRVITCGSDRKAFCWDLETGNRVGYVMEHDDAVEDVAISPDGSLVATASSDYTVKVWNSSNFSPIAESHVLYHPHRAVLLKFLDNHSILVLCRGGDTYLWKYDQSALVREVPRAFDVPSKKIVSTPSVELFASSNIVRGTIRGSPFSVRTTAVIETIAVDPAEQLVAIGTRDNGRAPHSVQLYDSSGNPMGRAMPHKDGITYIKFSHSGKMIGTCSEDFSARIWDREGKSLTPPLKHKKQVHWLDFNKSDEWVVTGSWDETVRVWNARSGVPVTVPLKVDNLADYVCFRGDRELFIANAKRNYVLTLPFFEGDFAALLRSNPAPPEAEEF